MLSERREALAEHSATLQRLCLQAKVRGTKEAR